ncbi:hypothetical protein OJAV_G00224030 [Oryzias javanicus]|uniref:Uncharacterized protein n=1 Tax=Oryzias javanicus TaxID=123683 RepID=A0A3S2LZ11_ORYJA|nr:hypothetical protein OJAV_G00224030 [Oryzias javanicus]
MESLLDNPMKAVLYLKELTTIVQNQQSLIQTQRQRIDELERKVEDLIGENRQLRDPHLYVQQPSHHHHHHHHPTHRSASPQAPAHLHQLPGSSNKAHISQQQQQHPQQQQQHPPPPHLSSRLPLQRRSISTTRLPPRSCSSFPPRRSPLKSAKPAPTPPRRTRGAPAASLWFLRPPPRSAAPWVWPGKPRTKQSFTSSVAQPQRSQKGKPPPHVCPGKTIASCQHLHNCNSL